METGKGVLHRVPDACHESVLFFEGFVQWGSEQRSASAALDLHVDPLPTLEIEIQSVAVSGLLEMNQGQQSRAEPDLMGFVDVGGAKYAAGAWIPRKKLKKSWFLLILRPAIPANRMSQTPDDVFRPL
ncbi:hypothetical protein Q8W37_19335 [Shimia thalassica]|uniref:hypothetical protein n=1 Tax=Shimia thalassica TaxID=1715693 RepID=UPI0027359115|nr:hypothetical protein [Shimia thalassica]MDP2582101.1 hypothetical protein [Shimia thalassica]